MLGKPFQIHLVDQHVTGENYLVRLHSLHSSLNIAKDIK
jgi:hypothetical protein